MKVCILISKDPTQGERVMTEVKFLNKLVDHSSTPVEFEFVSLGKKHLTQVESWIKSNELTVNAKCVYFNATGNLEYFDKFDIMFGWPTEAVLWGGVANKRYVTFYNILSYFTNNLDRNVIYRCADYTNKMTDYKKLLTSKKTYKPTVDNVMLSEIPGVNYKNVHWLLNGNKDKYDWLPECIEKTPEKIRICDPTLASKNSAYVSDDIFFLVKDNMDKYNYLTQNVNNKLFYIGFMDYANKPRTKCFKEIYKDNEFKIPIEIYGRGTESLNKIESDNVVLHEKLIKGDCHEYYKLLSDHLAYVYVGKGPEQTKYTNKTIYDASIAKTPIILYRKSDPNMHLFDDPKFYFETETELKAIYTMLQIPSQRAQWVQEQREHLLKDLNNINFNWNNYNKNNR